MDKAIRHNSGKPRWHLVDFESLTGLVRVLEWGADRYGEFNWKKGLDKTEISESLIRHAMKLANGVIYDEESGFLHSDHIIANAMFYNYFHKLGEEKKVLKTDMILGGLRPLDWKLKSTSEEDINERK